MLVILLALLKFAAFLAVVAAAAILLGASVARGAAWRRLPPSSPVLDDGLGPYGHATGLSAGSTSHCLQSDAGSGDCGGGDGGSGE